MVFYMSTTSLHGDTMAPMVSHGNFHGFTCGIFMEYMKSHGISWKYHGPHHIPWKFLCVSIWSFHGLYEILWNFTQIPHWVSIETLRGTSVQEVLNGILCVAYIDSL